VHSRTNCGWPGTRARLKHTLLHRRIIVELIRVGVYTVLALEGIPQRLMLHMGYQAEKRKRKRERLNRTERQMVKGLW